MAEIQWIPKRERERERGGGVRRGHGALIMEHD